MKCFWWLSLKDKILTWYNLMKRGWQGPIFCPLCRQEEETILHIFINCFFFKQVCLVAKEFFGFSLDWGADNLEVYFSDWFHNVDSFNLLPIFMSSSLHISRNKVVFQYISPNSFLCGINGINLFKDYLNIDPPKNTKRYFLTYFTASCVEDHFDGASNSSSCGCGMAVILNKDHYFFKIGWRTRNQYQG